MSVMGPVDTKPPSHGRKNTIRIKALQTIDNVSPFQGWFRGAPYL